MKTLKLFIITGLLNLYFPALTQVEFLVSINPFTGTHTKIDSLPGVKWIHTVPNYHTFDQVNGRYIFKGADINMNSGLYSVDVNTGTVVSSPAFPVLSDPDDNIIELQYDYITSTLYGLHWDASIQTEFLVTIDLATGIHTIIDSIPGVKWVTTAPSYTTFDSDNGLFIFRGADVNMNSKLYSVNVSTGNVISSPDFPVLTNSSDNILELQFDNVSGNLYALHWSHALQTEFLVSINPTTGLHSIIDSIPGIRWIATNTFTSFDEINGRYIFYGEGNITSSKLLSIDVITGKAISMAPFPVLSESSDNIIELHFDNSTGTLYALHWDSRLELGLNNVLLAESTNIYPNPFTEKTTITLSKVYPQITVNVYNSNGKIVRSINRTDTQELEIFKNNLPPGLYYFHISADKANTVRKVVIQ